MRIMTIFFTLPLLLAFTHPFARDGSVNTDDLIMQERIERAKENRRDQQEALDVIEKEKQEEQQVKDEEASDEELNEAERLVR